MEAADPGRAGAFAERGEQRDADALVLPAVDDLDRHLGGLEVVLKADVPGDRNRGARRRRVRDQRLVVPVIDVEEPPQVTCAQHRFGREEALEAGALAQPGERECDGPAI